MPFNDELSNALAQFQTAIRELRNILLDVKIELAVLSSAVTHTDRILNVSDHNQKRIRTALASGSKLNAGGRNFLKDIDGKIKAMGDEPTLTIKQFGVLMRIFNDLNI